MSRLGRWDVPRARFPATDSALSGVRLPSPCAAAASLRLSGRRARPPLSVVARSPNSLDFGAQRAAARSLVAALRVPSRSRARALIGRPWASMERRSAGHHVWPLAGAGMLISGLLDRLRSRHADWKPATLNPYAAAVQRARGIPEYLFDSFRGRCGDLSTTYLRLDRGLPRARRRARHRRARRHRAARAVNSRTDGDLRLSSPSAACRMRRGITSTSIRDWTACRRGSSGGCGTHACRSRESRRRSRGRP